MYRRKARRQTCLACWLGEALLLTMGLEAIISWMQKSESTRIVLPVTRMEKKREISEQSRCMKSLPRLNGSSKSWISISRAQVAASDKLVCGNDMQSRKLLSSAVSTLFRFLFSFFRVDDCTESMISGRHGEPKPALTQIHFAFNQPWNRKMVWQDYTVDGHKEARNYGEEAVKLNDGFSPTTSRCSGWDGEVECYLTNKIRKLPGGIAQVEIVEDRCILLSSVVEHGNVTNRLRAAWARKLVNFF